MQFLESVQTPTITSASAYASGQAIGGLLSFSDVTRQGAATLKMLIINDLSNQKAPIDLILFNRSFTATADKSALAISGADSLNCLGSINILAANYVGISAGVAVATLSGLLLPLMSQGGQNSIYGQLVSRGTPTYTSTTALQVRAVFERHLNNMF